MTTVSLADPYADQLSDAYDARMRGDIWTGSASWNSPSVIGHPCLRYLVLRRTKGDLQKPVSLDAKKRMEMGNIIGNCAKNIAIQYGFEILRMEEMIEYRALKLRGKADTVMRPPGGDGPYRIFEVKSIADRLFDTISDVDSLLNNRSVFVRRYPYQPMAYMMLERHKRATRDRVDLDMATLWFWALPSGRWKFVPVPFDAKMEGEICNKCEAVNADIANGLEPMPMNDPDICPACSFFMTDACNPTLAMAADTAVIDGEEDVEGVKRLLELRPLASEYEYLRKRLSTRFEGVEQALVPDVAVVTGKRIERQMPALPARTDSFWQVKYLPLQEERED